MPTTSGDQCALQNDGMPCVCGRLRRGCPHLIRARARQLAVTLAEGLGARRVLELAVAIRAMPGVVEVRAH